MSKTEMLINCITGEECRIAIVTDGRLEELYQERASTESHVGNIYKGRVKNVEPSIQAAFIEFGLERNGFLHISDLHPRYFPGKDSQDAERVGKKTRHRDRPPIQRCLRRDQEILVQILKEGINTKGPTLTSYLSIPGRYLVMMPYMERMGVSRKIDDDDARRQMRKILNELDPPKDFGFIIRTAGIGRTKTDLRRDLAYLQRLWNIIEQRCNSNMRVGELYAESDLVIRTIRDVYSTEIERIVVDDEEAARRAKGYLEIASPRSTSNVCLYSDQIPLFYRYGIEEQIEKINSRVVELPSGGSLVIDSTEALVAIDVNSGKMRDNRDAETTAYKTNLEAADEVCRQLRLRDLGGVIIVDLIDMRDAKHRRAVEQCFRTNLKRDRARTRVLSISQLGILEMTRQRMRPSLAKSLTTDCPQCGRTGQVKNCESVILEVVRRLNTVMHEDEVVKVEVTISPDFAFDLLNYKRSDLVQLEEKYGKPILVRVHSGMPIDHVEITARDKKEGIVEPVAAKGTPKTISIKDLPPAPRAAPKASSQPRVESESEGEVRNDADSADRGETNSRRRRRRRGGRRKKGTGQGQDGEPVKDAASSEGPAKDAASSERPAKKPQRKRSNARSTPSASDRSKPSPKAAATATRSSPPTTGEVRTSNHDHDPPA